MKKGISIIVVGISCVLLVICLFQINHLKEQLQSLESNVSHNISNMESSISSIYSNIDMKLEEQSNLLANSDWTFGDPDIEDGTVKVKCTVSPKEYRPEGTRAILMCNGTEYPMLLENREYTVVIPISLFEESHVSKVQFIEDDTVYTENLDWYLSPRYDYLPMVYANFAGSADGKVKGGSYVKSYDGIIDINIEQEGDMVDVQSITMIECINEKETTRTEIPLSTTTSTGESVNSIENPAYFYYDLDKSVEILFNNTYSIYIEVVDSYNLHYRVLIDYEAIGDNGEPIDDFEWWYHVESSIYNEKGEALFVPDEEL